MSESKFDIFLYDIVSLRERLNQLFDDSLVRGRFHVDVPGMGMWTPPIDAWETDSEIVITAEIPGVDVSDMDVRLQDGALTIKGVREVNRGAGKATFNRMERPYGTFFRSVKLPDAVDPDGISASCDSGVLRVNLKKRRRSKTKSIAIRSAR